MQFKNTSMLYMAYNHMMLQLQVSQAASGEVSTWEVTYKDAPGVSGGGGGGGRVTWRWVFHQVAWSASPALWESECQERRREEEKRGGPSLTV